MGYESKIFAVTRCGFKSSIDGYNSSITIATLDIGKAVYTPDGKKLIDLFDKETDFAIYTNVCNEREEVMADTITDPYGDRITYLTKKKAAIKLLNKIVKKYEDYEPYKWLLNFIKSFENNDDIYICHYGH